MGLIGRTIRERTHGEPPDRACLGGSDDKWGGYLLGVEEAAVVAEGQLAGAVAALRILADHTEWWLHSQEHEPMPHPADVLEAAVRAPDAIGGQ